ncbi:hypothetical protein [Glutamicibacter sp.]|jgi:hypothetical protein|uniref:hypothetical protein n=1 Tax=Glutamicibacter sp. TaxID=1931995 RepID=UPI002B4A363A|nr:hypothetical protein [Glutamicibacter sp.]HJX77309.1 hypothetical protein [Glutamicibacter sp.]
MPNTPLNPDALETAAKATMGTVYGNLPTEEMHVAVARAAVSAYLAVAQPVVNSVEELDKLPAGSVILDGDPCVLQMVEKSSIVGSEWAIANAEHIYTTGKITLPARVLYRPEVKP